jgi:hypothetical protein
MLSAREKSQVRCGFRTAHGAESARERRSSAKAPAVHGGLTIAWCSSMTAHILSVAALESSPDGPLAANPRLVNVRSQVAVVRALADQVERLSRVADVDGLGTQIVEEMARLGGRLLDAAHWEPPTYELVRMDSEIGSYREDDDPGREAPPFAQQLGSQARGHETAGEQDGFDR